MGEPLADEEQFTLRSDTGRLMRIDRIAWPDALRGASVSLQTFGPNDEAIINPIDSKKLLT